jgi:hypothetical protein
VEAERGKWSFLREELRKLHFGRKGAEDSLPLMENMVV